MSNWKGKNSSGLTFINIRYCIGLSLNLSLRHTTLETKVKLSKFESAKASRVALRFNPFRSHSFTEARVSLVLLFTFALCSIIIIDADMTL